MLEITEGRITMEIERKKGEKGEIVSESCLAEWGFREDT